MRCAELESVSLHDLVRVRVLVIVHVWRRGHESSQYVAQKMADALLAHEKAGDYSAAMAGAPFAALLTRQLRDVSHDMHLEVVYSRTPLPERPTGPSPERTARYRAALEQQNCTLEKAGTPNCSKRYAGVLSAAPSIGPKSGDFPSASEGSQINIDSTACPRACVGRSWGTSLAARTTVARTAGPCPAVCGFQRAGHGPTVRAQTARPSALPRFLESLVAARTSACATKTPAMFGENSPLLEDFEYSVQNPARQPLAHRYRHDSIEPRIFGRGRLEERRGPQIVFGWRDGLPAGDPRVHVRWAVPYTAIRHENDRAVIRAKQQSDILLSGSIRANEQKIGARVREYFPTKTLPREMASRHGENAAFARGRRAQFNGGMQLDGQIKQMSGFQLAHFSSVFLRAQ